MRALASLKAPRLPPPHWIALGLLALVELALLLKASSLVTLNSDHVQSFATAGEILRGNVLLRGWVMADDNFYLSNTPFFVLTRLLYGRSLPTLYVATFLIYVVLLAAAIRIVVINARDRFALIAGLAALLFYLGTPDSGSLAPAVLAGGNHVAVMTYAVLAWLALDTALKAEAPRARRLSMAFFAAAAFIAMMSDPFAVVVFAIPTVIALIFALLTPDRRPAYAGLIAITLASLVAAQLALAAVAALGGFTTVINHSLIFVHSGNLGRNAMGVFFGLQWMSGGYLYGRTLDTIPTLIAIARLLGLGLMLAAVATALRRGLRCADGFDLRFVLALAVLIDLASCLASDSYTGALVALPFTGAYANRYLIPALLFGGILTALELPALLGRVGAPALRWSLAALCGVAMIAAATQFAVQGIAQWHESPAAARGPGAKAAAWLLSRGLTHGVGSYWTGLLITAVSGEKVTVRAVIGRDGRLAPFAWLTNMNWYRDAPRPQFVIYEPQANFGISPQTIAATYGPATAIEHVEGYDVVLLAPAAR